MSRSPYNPGPMTPKTLGLLSSALPSPAGDAVGLLADAWGYAKDPKSLTPAAGLLSIAGALPGVPSLGAKRMLKGPELREALHYWVGESGSLKQAIKELRQMAKNEPMLREIADYGDEIDGIIRFHKADDSDPRKLAAWLRQRGTSTVDTKMAADVVDIENARGFWKE